MNPKKDSNSKEIADILKEKSIISSSEVQEILCKKYGITKDTARQRISRARKNNRNIYTITDIALCHNACILYIKGAPQEKILAGLKKYSPPYKRALYAIEILHGGFITKERFAIVCGSPEKSKKHIVYTKIIDTLLKNKFIEEKKIKEVVYYTSITNKENITHVQEHLEIYIGEKVKQWLKNISFGSSKCMEEKNEFASFRWDITSPCYIGAFYSTKESNTKKAKAFIVGDILCRDVKKEDIEYYLNKHDIIKNQKNIIPCMFFLFVFSFNKDVLDECKNRGISLVCIKTIIPNIEEIREFHDSLEMLESALANKEKAYKNIASLLGQIKGDSFEYMTSTIATNILKKKGENIEESFRGREIRNNQDEQKEIDVIICTEKKVIFYECKAHSSNIIDIGDIEKWIQTVNFIKNLLKEEGEINSRGNAKEWIEKIKEKEIVFEYWTTTDFTEKCLDFLEKHKNKDICTLRNKNNIMKLIRDNALGRSHKKSIENLTKLTS